MMSLYYCTHQGSHIRRSAANCLRNALHKLARPYAVRIAIATFGFAHLFGLRKNVYINSYSHTIKHTQIFSLSRNVSWLANLSYIRNFCLFIHSHIMFMNFIIQVFLLESTRLLDFAVQAGLF